MDQSVSIPLQDPPPAGKSTKFIKNVEKTEKRQTYHILNTSETIYLCFANVLAQKMHKKLTKFDKKVKIWKKDQQKPYSERFINTIPVLY